MNDQPPRRTDSRMIPLRDIMPEVMAQIIDRARAANHPPPSFVTDRFERPTLDKPPSPSSR